MKLLLFLFSSLLLASCTYVPDGLTFNDIEKPQVGPAIEVTLSNNTDSIYLYANTDISFSIKILGEKFNAAVVHYYDKEITTYQPTSTFTIQPKETTDWTDLTIDFYVATGSGSVADQLKSEFAKVTKKWKIKYFDIKKTGFKSSYRIHKDGYLQVYMVKPKGAMGLTYDYWYPNDNAIKSEKGDTVFYTLKRYISGNENFTFNAKLSDYIILHSETVTLNVPAPTFEVTQILGDSCMLSCTSSPIKCFYGMMNGKIHEGTTANWKVPYVFDYPYNSVNIYLYAWGDFQGLNQIRSIYFNPPFMGNKYNFKSCYSLEKDRFYLSTDANYPVLTSSALPLPIGDEWATNPKMIVSCSPNGKYIGGYYNNKVYVYDDNMKSETQLTADALSNLRKYIAITNDGVFTYQKGAEIVMKNLTGVGWQSFSFTSNADATVNANYVSNIANTIDGKYICVRGASDFKIYDVSNHTTATVIYENASGDYRGAIAHPTNPSLVYVKKATSIELRSLPGFDIVKTINLPFTTSIMHALDPYTSIFVLSSGNYYYFLDAETGKVIYKLKSMWDVSTYEATLNRNQFVSNSRIIDLTNYLKK